MPIDPDVALAAELDPIEFSWSSSDVQLYHLGLGAGADPMDPRELRYLVDDTPQVLPTFGNVAATFHATEPAFAAGKDRAPLRPEQGPVRRSDSGLGPDHRGLALVPDVGEPGDGFRGT